MLLSGNIHTHQSWHGCYFLFLPLALLVARVCADHAHHALAADDATVLADATNGTTYFHWLTLLSVVERKDIISKTVLLGKGGNEKKAISAILCILPPQAANTTAAATSLRQLHNDPLRTGYLLASNEMVPDTWDVGACFSFSFFSASSSFLLASLQHFGVRFSAIPP